MTRFTGAGYAGSELRDDKAPPGLGTRLAGALRLYGKDDALMCKHDDGTEHVVHSAAELQELGVKLWNDAD